MIFKRKSPLLIILKKSLLPAVLIIRTAEIMKSYFEKSIIQDLKVGDEYYVSMAYKPMMDDRLNVLVYELQHFMQWGTPEDLAEYNYWSDIFYSVQKEKEPPHQKGTLMIPMAGLGSRFKDKGYEVPKPLIPVCLLYTSPSPRD